MASLKMSPENEAPSFRLWETGRSKSSDDPENDMPLVVICTSACADLGVALTTAQLKGDIRYLSASTSSDGDLRDIPRFGTVVPEPIAAMRHVGLVFIAVDLEVDVDLSVACKVAHAARQTGLFVVALAMSTTSSTCDDRLPETERLREFDSVVSLRDERVRALLLACDIVGHIAGGLKVVPPVCTDLADVQAILRGAIVSVGLGEAIRSPNLLDRGSEWDAAEIAIRNLGRSEVSSATGVIVAIASNCSVRLSEISGVTHQVGDVVTGSSALVIPTVHIEPGERDYFKVMLLAAHRPALV